jgi:hypothetical protein
LTENNLTVVSLNPKGSLSGKAEPVKPVAAGEIQKFELSNGLRLLVRKIIGCRSWDGRRVSRWLAR